MSLYAIGDLHLSLTANKPMDVFGDRWANYTERLQASLSELHEDDTLLLVGDTSWGIDLAESLADFRFLDSFPGRKLLVKGNHDYWWETTSKMKRFFTEHGIMTLDILHNNCFFYGDYALCGTRGWFYEEDAAGTHTGKMIAREVMRLEASFRAAEGREILCFLHYPPLYRGYECPELLELIDRYPVKACYYGHLHGASHRLAIEGTRKKTDYFLISADYLGFVPKKIP